MTVLGIIDHGKSNIDSVERALRLSGASTVHRLSRPEQFVDIEKLVLPGVGSFDSVMSRLNELNLTSAIRDAVLIHKMPLLGVCLGMQLLFHRSEEGKPLDGLGLIPGEVRKMQPNLGERIPHIGWNEIHIHRQSEILTSNMNHKDFYFVHSFSACPTNKDDVIATTPFADQIVAVVQRDRVYGTQFHPEKSSRQGLEIIRLFVELG